MKRIYLFCVVVFTSGYLHPAQAQPFSLSNEFTGPNKCLDIVNDGANNGFPCVEFVAAGYSRLGDPNCNARTLQTNNAFQINESLSLIRGKHNLKFGFDYRFMETNGIDNFQAPGLFQFNALETGLPNVANSGNAIASFLLGAVNRDRVGFLYASPAGYTLKEPVRGRGQILHAAATLLGQSAPVIENRELPTESSFVPWRLLAKAAPRHSIMIWLGDFPPRIAPEGWSVLSRRYQTMGFRVDDPWERELPSDRVLTTYDPVAGRIVTLNGATTAQRTAHAAWGQQRDDAFRAIFPAPLSRLVVGTHESRLDALVRFFHARMAAGKKR